MQHLANRILLKMLISDKIPVEMHCIFVNWLNKCSLQSKLCNWRNTKLPKQCAS